MKTHTHTHTPCIIRLLEKCISMREFKQIHGHTITHGLARFSFVSGNLLSFCARADLRYAQSLFSHTPFLNLFHYNTIIAAFSRHHSSTTTSSLFRQMLNDAVRPDSCTLALLSKACPPQPLSFLQQLHSHILRLGHVSDVYVITSLVTAYSNHAAIRAARRVFDESPNKNVVCWTSLVTAYCNCNCAGMVKNARELFDAMPDKNEVSYGAMVSGYVRNGFFREGIQLFRELVIKPSNSLLVSVLSACAAVGAFEEGKWIIQSYVDDGNRLEYEVELGTALIDFYAKCGCVQPAERVFGKMRIKDVGAWSAMILGLAVNAKNHEALELFAEMEKVGPRPNAITFIGVLSACNHRDLLGGAIRLFRYMSEKYGIVASIEHYGCVVDVLARGGEIEEALRFIMGMKLEPDRAIWASLLNGCLLHNNVELGEKVGKYLIELRPGHSGGYVLLSNVYASAGRWEDAVEIRKLMIERRVPLISAASFVE